MTYTEGDYVESDNIDKFGVALHAFKAGFESGREFPMANSEEEFDDWYKQRRNSTPGQDDYS